MLTDKKRKSILNEKIIMKLTIPYPEITCLSKNLWLVTVYSSLTEDVLIKKNYLISTGWSIARQISLTGAASQAIREMTRKGSKNVH